MRTTSPASIPTTLRKRRWHERSAYRKKDRENSWEQKRNERPGGNRTTRGRRQPASGDRTKETGDGDTARRAQGGEEAILFPRASAGEVVHLGGIDCPGGRRFPRMAVLCST